MPTINRACLGVVIAGVMAGAGSAVATAVAYADPSAPDTSSSTSTAQDTSDRNAGAQRTRSRGPAAGSRRGGSKEQGGDAHSPAPRNKSRAAEAAAAVNAGDGQTPAPPDEPLGSAATGTAPAATGHVGDGDPVRVVAPVPAEPAPVLSAPAPAPTAVVVPRAARAAPVLTPAPAAPAPTPVRIPLLPELPAVPVAPAGAVTVSATSGTNTRLRAASAVAQAEVLADPPTHVLLIGVDGTNLEKILADPANVGFFDLMDQSVTAATSIVGHTTISGPSWSTILTGAWDNKTGVLNNLFRPEPYTKWPTVINLLEYNNPAIKTTVIADWQYMNDIGDAGGYPANKNIFVEFTDSWAATDALVKDATVAEILATIQDPDTPSFLFSYQVQVDEAGHEYGGGSQQYKQAVTNVSDNIAAIMGAVAIVEAATGQDWTVIVTTDHGHQEAQGSGHGFQSPIETSSFVIFDLAGDDANDGKQNLAYTTADVTPTIVSLFGVPLRSDFDGVPMQTKQSSIVAPDDLNQALNDAISMYGYPDASVNSALTLRTVFASIPYFIDNFIADITHQLQAIVDKDIFVISGLAAITEWIVQFNGNLLVGVTQGLAQVVGYLTGAGTIPPTDPPLPPPPGDSELLLVNGAAVLA